MSLIIRFFGITVFAAAFVFLADYVSFAQASDAGGRSDELFERYLALRIQALERKDGGLPTPEEIMYGPTKPSIDVTEAMKKWEAEYADDPVYWEIMYFNSKWEGGKPLYEKLESGVESPALYYGLFIFAGEKLLKSDPSLAMKLVNRAIALDPDNSYFYYVKAWISSERDDWKACLDELNAGKAAPKNEIPELFLLSHVLAHPKRFASDRELAAAIHILVSWPVPKLSQTREFATEICDRLISDYSPETADALLTYGMRLSAMDGQAVIGIMIGHEISKKVLRKMMEGPANMDESEMHEAHALLGRLLVNRTKVKKYFKGFTFPTAEDWKGQYELILDEYRFCAEFGASYDFLSPPPFVDWAKD